MPRPLLMLTLLIALTSTPLRLAEAADDFARTLSEIGEDACVEEIDGGVGDDQGESIKVDHAESSDVAAVDGVPAGISALEILIPGPAARLAAHPPSRSRAVPVRRYILLRCFRC